MEIELVDFHVHSTASDGTDAPGDIPELAHKEGIVAMALTDHDTTAGVPAFLRGTAEMGILGIPGIEVSTEIDGKRLHMLGFGVPTTGSSPLHKFLTVVRRWRDDRNLEMLERFNSLGIKMNLPEVVAEAGGKVIGRPHFAKLLLRMEVVGSMNEAFRSYLGNTGPAFVPKRKPSPQEVIEVLHASGAVALAAHPRSLEDHTMTGLEKSLDALVEAGLDGLEIYHPDVSPALRKRLQSYGEHHGLIYSCGSDYHGRNKSKARLGRGYKGARIREHCSQSLLNRLTEMGIVTKR